ncbi:hypothetical protein M569_12880 [Genlisea aurea]|uniref:DUF1677 family protein n=1 Tax=Genlisea aurea TaxID=192259 RepID=S8C568_9LAMI|nr:hypothetical protein M569_12880 [Genlisea aurea]
MSSKKIPATEAAAPLHRTISDISHDAMNHSSAVEKARCDCCGLCEDFTVSYVRRVREKHCGRMVCGLCSEAVKMEMEKNPDRSIQEALNAHVSACVRQNRFSNN